MKKIPFNDRSDKEESGVFDCYGEIKEHGKIMETTYNFCLTYCMYARQILSHCKECGKPINGELYCTYGDEN